MPATYLPVMFLLIESDYFLMDCFSFGIGGENLMKKLDLRGGNFMILLFIPFPSVSCIFDSLPDEFSSHSSLE
jgi:hypothetical protein